MSAARSRPSVLPTAVTGFVIAIVAVLGIASPASAHDELVGSSPAADEQFDSAPTEVVLTFSAAILPDGAAIEVVDADGENWTEGESVIDTNTLTVPLSADLPEAGYVVEWRVVSSDGHPISGAIPFAVGDAEPLDPADVPAEASEPGTTTGESSAVPVVVGGIIVAAAVVAIVIVLVVRRRATPPTDG